MTELPEDNPDVAAAYAAPAASVAHEEPVLAFSAGTIEEAEVVRATLEAAGIPATLLFPNTNSGFAVLGEHSGEFAVNGVYVSPSNLEAAQAVLNEPPLSDEELIAGADDSPAALEAAEARAQAE